MSARLKTLETLVQEAAKHVKRLSTDNLKLRAEADALEKENQRLKQQVRSLAAVGVRQEKLKARVERLLQKLDKAGA